MKNDVSIIFPCLNEENTLDKCIKSVKQVMKNSKYKYEIIVVDNGSIDSSVSIAKKNKVKVINEELKGYGSALKKGINESNGKYIVMLDSDCSYDTESIPKMIKMLDKGYDLVVGNRFNQESKKDAFKLSRVIGAKVLTLIGNILFNTKIKDFHCGLRAFNTEKIKGLDLQSNGMEFASEMIIKAKLKKLKMINDNTKYFKDERIGKSHLNIFKDGFRHLKLINKIKYDNSYLFRYLTTFIITMFILIILLYLCCFKSNNISNNAIDSYKYYLEDNYHNKLDNNDYRGFKLDNSIDCVMISIASLVDSNNKINSIIEMNQYKIDELHRTKKSFLETSNGIYEKEQYARYWHGYIIILRPLLALMNAKYIHIIIAIICITLFILLLVVLFKNDKWLAIVFLLASIITNSYIAYLCFETAFIFIIAYVISLLIINMYKKNSKYVDVLLFISGMLTCFFDFLTVETISFTIPMFIYLYLFIKDKKEIKLKNILKYSICWVLGYAITFGLKWLIDIIYYGPSFINLLKSDMVVRIYDNKMSPLILGSVSIINSFRFMFPICFIQYDLFVLALVLLIAIYNFVFNYKDRIKYLWLILISIIPIVRFYTLSTHSTTHLFFTYRAFIPCVMLICIFIFNIHIVDKDNK
jgi:glycosyltransferase involved in cell wall biosynthesis